jgi:hypothetical protein
LSCKRPAYSESNDSKLFNEPCWEKITNGKKDSYIIFPYKDGKIIEENQFKTDNPLTYNYLCEYKDLLSQRDKGKKKYPLWYAFGRTQALIKPKNNCIYLPCFINIDNINDYLNIKEPLLYKSCLCIEPFKQDNIHQIIEIIKNNIEFINLNSSKRSGGWINLSSRILYNCI